MARRHDAGEAGRGTRPQRCRCRACPTSGCRRSATASTCWPPASRARSASRWRAPTWREIDRIARRDRARGEGRARRHLARWPSALTGGRYIDVDIDRDAAARYGLNIADVQIGRQLRRSAARTSARRSRACSAFRSTCATRASCATRWRSCASCRSSPSAARSIALGDVADVRITDGPPMLQQRERAAVRLGLCRHPRPRPAVGGAATCSARWREQVKLPPGYSVAWSGQFEYPGARQERSWQLVVPFTLLIIFVLLYLTFRSARSRRC